MEITKIPDSPETRHAIPIELSASEPSPAAASSVMRTTTTGATRNSDANQPDYEGFLSPRVIRAYGAYMHKHRKQADGTLRASDNWQKGMPQEWYMQSMFRHFMDVWCAHRGLPMLETDDVAEALCALLFNVMGELHEVLKARETENK